MRAAEHRDTVQLVGARAFEEYIFSRYAISLRIEEAATFHPAPCRLAQIDLFRGEMPILGLVAHDVDIMPFSMASPQKFVDPVEHDGVDDSGTVYEPLQPLPGQLAARLQPNGVSDRLFIADEVLRKQAMRLCGREEYLIVA